MKTKIGRWLFLAFLSTGVPGSAAPLSVGDAVPPISARDQHGTAYIFTNGTTRLLVAAEMDPAKAANKALAGQGAGFLEKHGAVYLMDIHPMPRIAKVFALPKMRKYPHRIVLIESAGALNWAPTKPGHVTVLSLTTAGLVEQIAYWNPGTEPVTGVFQ